jgi:lipopolysaccharide export system protein LptA
VFTKGVLTTNLSKISRSAALILTIISLFFSAAALALPDDRKRAISIESDSAERNQNTGLTIYSGNVIISQGSILIEADQITLHYQGSKISRIECTGTPASYQQQPLADGPMLVARAEHIDYLLADDQIILKRNAILSRNGTTIRGDSIDYDIKNETWKAKGDNLGEQKRIQLVIPPSVQESTPLTETP